MLKVPFFLNSPKGNVLLLLLITLWSTEQTLNAILRRSLIDGEMSFVRAVVCSLPDTLLCQFMGIHLTDMALVSLIISKTWATEKMLNFSLQQS